MNISRSVSIPPTFLLQGLPLLALATLIESQDRVIPGRSVASLHRHPQQGQSTPKRDLPRRFFLRADWFEHCCFVLQQLEPAARCVLAQTMSE